MCVYAEILAALLTPMLRIHDRHSTRSPACQIPYVIQLSAAYIRSRAHRPAHRAGTPCLHSILHPYHRLRQVFNSLDLYARIQHILPRSQSLLYLFLFHPTVLLHPSILLQSPLLGRFASPDTIVPNPNDPQALNRYAYSRNNPLRYVDPSGSSGHNVENCE